MSKRDSFFRQRFDEPRRLADRLAHGRAALRASLQSVSANYRFDLAPYTWEGIRGFRGGRALFTQPAMPIKCAGAPQKIMYLAAKHFRRSRIASEIRFFTPGAAIFGVPFYSKALELVVDAYAIHAVRTQPGGSRRGEQAGVVRSRRRRW